ncbi:hypothetical protein ACFB49_19510 [Sphingomonas sp. DBB INV C78]|uniref:2-amino-4-hydroxy-6- hydroxymethyldihydropteridine diphosphokinase n=1 Tax=Sphingomonas sp. DBB INV C78 TaxID=3349434 RepID=UPI0036D42930
MPRTSYAIALGSNRRHGRHGPPERVIAAALAALEAEGVRVIRASPLIRTAALGPAGRGFANAAAIVECDLDPPHLLALLKRTERAFGRRRGRRWGSRVLDLDIILWSGGVWYDRALAVPHREFHRRSFVLDPLVRIAPDWRHPVSGRTVRQMRARLRRQPLPETHPSP